MGLSWRAMKLMHADTLATVMFSEETLHPVLSADLGGLWTHWCCVLKPRLREFPGGSEARTPRSPCREPRFDPWSGNWIPHAAPVTWHCQ